MNDLKTRIANVLIDYPTATADEIAKALVDEDVSKGEYEGCSSELEMAYGEYKSAAWFYMRGAS